MAKRSDMKVVVKGVMCKEDGIQAISMGADAIYISNGCHKKAVGVPCTISVLKSIAQGVRARYPQAEIMIDSGSRRGTDVMKCLAYGANAVVLNRPIMWGLYFNGQNGVKSLCTMLNEELKLAMALTHCFKLEEITEQQVIHMVKPRL